MEIINKHTKKTLIVDINHTPQANFWIHICKSLRKEYNVIITHTGRAKLVRIINYEYGGFPIKQVGQYPTNRFLFGFYTIQRIFKMIRLCIDKDTCFIAGGYVAQVVSKIRDIKCITVCDDFEHFNFRIKRILARNKSLYTFVAIPGCQKNVVIKGYKELSYLHPDIFKSNKQTLKKIGLNENDYVLFRLTSRSSFNYNLRDKLLTTKLIKFFEKEKIRLVFSTELEIDKLPIKDSTVLEEPISDFHSILKYARLVISNGDSIVREASILGTPSVYLGGRSMLINNVFIKIGIIKKIDNFESNIDNLSVMLNLNYKAKFKSIINKYIINNCENPNLIITNYIKRHIET